jgi:hypothetical protein
MVEVGAAVQLGLQRHDAVICEQLGEAVRLREGHTVSDQDHPQMLVVSSDDALDRLGEQVRRSVVVGDAHRDEIVGPGLGECWLARNR